MVLFDSADKKILAVGLVLFAAIGIFTLSIAVIAAVALRTFLLLSGL